MISVFVSFDILTLYFERFWLCQKYPHPSSILWVFIICWIIWFVRAHFLSFHRRDYAFKSSTESVNNDRFFASNDDIENHTLMPLAFLGRQNSRIPPSQEKRALCTSFKYHQQSPLDMEAEYFVSVNIYLQNNKKRSKCEWPCHPSNYTYCRVAFILQEYKISTLCVIAHSDNGFE